jgi:hypothetical protein
MGRSAFVHLHALEYVLVNDDRERDPGTVDEGDGMEGIGEAGEGGEAAEAREAGEAAEGQEAGDAEGAEGSGGIEDVDGIEEEPAGRPRRRSRGRRAGFAVLRGVVVLVVAAIVYQLLIPSTHVIRSRLSRLVLTHPGVAAYNKTTPQAGEQDDTQTGLTALSNAAKRSPNRTGLYSKEWSVSSTSGAGMIAFLLPTEADATSALNQVRTQQLGASSYSTESLSRRSTYAVSGVPGSAGSTYTPTTKASGATPTLAVTAFQYGRVVAVSEVINTTTAPSDVSTMARSEYANLRQVEPGFSLTSVYRPPLATSLWAAGAVLLALIAAFTPVAWRRRADRRQRRYEEEMSHQVVVHGQVIMKHRR